MINEKKLKEAGKALQALGSFLVASFFVGALTSVIVWDRLNIIIAVIIWLPLAVFGIFSLNAGTALISSVKDDYKPGGST